MTMAPVFPVIIKEMKKDKLLDKAVNNPSNLRFSDFQRLLKLFGFELVRIRGSHFHYYNEMWGKLLPIQERKGMAKEYQVQFCPQPSFLIIFSAPHLIVSAIQKRNQLLMKFH